MQDNGTQSKDPHADAEKEGLAEKDGFFEKPISRRDMLRMAGAGGIGLALGAGGLFTGSRLAAGKAPAGAAAESVPFYGLHQAGITTPAQDFVCFAAFDLTTAHLSEVRALFRTWTDAAEKMSRGSFVGEGGGNLNLPPVDTGEAAGLLPVKLTVTFGVGPSFFDARFGLAAKRPAALADLPAFPGEALRPEWCGGDICVQVCANDMQVAFHAIRNFARIARGTAVLRWSQEGFQRTGAADPAGGTPRNLLGFKDGTGNPDVNDPQLMDKYAWAQGSDGSAWMERGSYMVVRRVRFRIEVWDRSTLGDQEATFGRYRSSGAPLGQQQEFDSLDLNKKDASGKVVIPGNAHVRLAHGDGSVRIIRRSYSFSSGIDNKTGQLDAGLLFICFQRDPRKQFVAIQQRLAANDALNEYIEHNGSAIFACFPGTSKGGYIGETLI